MDLRLRASTTTFTLRRWYKISTSWSFNNLSHLRCLRFSFFCLNIYWRILWSVKISTWNHINSVTKFSKCTPLPLTPSHVSGSSFHVFSSALKHRQSPYRVASTHIPDMYIITFCTLGKRKNLCWHQSILQLLETPLTSIGLLKLNGFVCQLHQWRWYSRKPFYKPLIITH